MDISSRWAFLQSTRFWAVVTAAVSVYLNQKGIFGDPEMQLIASISVLFTAIRTVDRIGDKLGE